VRPPVAAGVGNLGTLLADDTQHGLGVAPDDTGLCRDVIVPTDSRADLGDRRRQRPVELEVTLGRGRWGSYSTKHA
jgi:hypothetical protein